jgi:hypothetical protein
MTSEHPRIVDAIMKIILIARARKHIWLGRLHGHFALTAHLVIARARIVPTGIDIDYVLRMGTERTKTVNGLQEKLYQRALDN